MQRRLAARALRIAARGNRGERLAVNAQRVTDAPGEKAVDQRAARNEVAVDALILRHRPDIRLALDALEIDQERDAN